MCADIHSVTRNRELTDRSGIRPISYPWLGRDYKLHYSPQYNCRKALRSLDIFDCSSATDFRFIHLNHGFVSLFSVHTRIYNLCTDGLGLSIVISGLSPVSETVFASSASASEDDFPIKLLRIQV